MRMRSVVAVVVVMLATLGCRKAAIGIAAGTTVATAAGGTALVARSEERSPAYGTGVVLLSYSMVGLIVASVLLATPPTVADASPSGVYGWTETPPSPGGSPAPSTGDATHPDRGIDVAGRGANGGHFYDRTGALAGRVDPDGRFYDRTGSLAGRLDPDGRYYDRTGSTHGRVDPDGRYYDRTGSSAGRIDSDGRFYDRTGSTAGRIDSDGRIYDATGSYAGRVDGNCDEACRRETAGRILLERQ